MVVEALCVGTPVLAARTGGVAEVVRNGRNGLLVEPGDCLLVGRIRAGMLFGKRERAERLARREPA